MITKNILETYFPASPLNLLRGIEPHWTDALDVRSGYSFSARGGARMANGLA